MLSHLRRHPQNRSPHFYSSSGGNAGLACVVAAVELGHPATVVVPLTTKPLMISKLLAAGATQVIQHGATWKDADAHLRDALLKHDPHGVYVPPFDHADVWHGHSTLVDEIKQQLNRADPPPRTHVIKPDRSVETAAVRVPAAAEVVPDAIVCSVGGGGLFSGIMQGLERQAAWSDVAVVAVETQGAASLNAALEARSLVTLPGITSQATSLGCVRVAEQAFAYGKRRNVTSVVLTDAEAAMGCWRLADEERMMVELACGVSVALCYGGRMGMVLEEALWKGFNGNEIVVIVLCGGSNITVDTLADFRENLGAEKSVDGMVPTIYSNKRSVEEDDVCEPFRFAY
jgi:L-serine/L-threonine ammonia-lyase